MSPNTDSPHVTNKMKENTKVLKNRIALVAVAGSAALVPLAGISALTTGVAAAKTPKGISCSTLKGKVVIGATITEKVTLSNCTGTTGGSGKSKATVSSTGPNTTEVKWTNGKTTTASESAASGSFACPSGDDAEAVTGSVTQDNTKSTAVGAAVAGDVCYNPNTSKLSLSPGTKFTYAP